MSAHAVSRPSRAVVLALCAALVLESAAPALASDPREKLSLSQELTVTPGSGEYITGNYAGAILMPVNLWGDVAKPGIHHVPVQTDILTFLSLAGGPSAEASISDIKIKRRSRGQDEVISVDAHELLTQPGGKPPVLEANDIIIVPRERPLISNGAVTMISVITGVLGIVLSGYAISQTLKH